MRFVIGHHLTVDIANVLVDLPETGLAASDQRRRRRLTRPRRSRRDHRPRPTCPRWPAGMRMIARREEPHPGAQLTFTDIDGHRFQVFVTDLPDTDIAYLEALYRGRGRAERQICDTKATGLANLPSHSFAINHAWLQLTLCAHDLLAWSRLLALDGDLATAEPKRLRYCLFHTAGRIITTGRQTTCRLAANWPWTTDLVTAFDRVHSLPLRS